MDQNCKNWQILRVVHNDLELTGGFSCKSSPLRGFTFELLNVLTQVNHPPHHMTMGDLPKLDLQLSSKNIGMQLCLWATVCFNRHSIIVHLCVLCFHFCVPVEEYHIPDMILDNLNKRVSRYLSLSKYIWENGSLYFVFIHVHCTFYIVFSSACLLWHKAPIKFPQHK